MAVLSVAVAMAIFTGINGFFMASSRLLFSMGRARLLPAWFGAIDPARGTPRNALLFTGAVSLLAPWFGREAIVWVVDMAAVGTACGYLYTCLAAFSVACSRQLGHVPLIDSNPRRDAHKKAELQREALAQRSIGQLTPQARRYHERSTVERVNGRLKDEFGGRHVRVRGHGGKVLCRLMFGVVALTVD